MPCSEKRARLLLARGRARVHRQVPFVIRLVDRVQEDCELQSVTVKLDPGSKTTGIALVRQKDLRVTVLSLMELVHRGATISKMLHRRAGHRRRRRTTNLRYRDVRFINRTRPKGWLPPSLMHRVQTTMSWVNRLRRWVPVDGLAVERVKFDTQKMQNLEISGPEYQQGTLYGYEVKEYLLEKWGRKCAYCSAENVPLEVEHILAVSKGGSNRVSNLALACRCCNQKKDNLHIEVFLKDKPDLLKRIKAWAKVPLRDAAAVNATRNRLFAELLNTGLPVETGTGAQTKFNRKHLDIPKTHALDAACVGQVAYIDNWRQPMLTILATGRGGYQRTRLTAYGFPRGYLTRQKRHFGFQTGDHVRARIMSGARKGSYLGRVAVRASGRFNIRTPYGIINSILYKNFVLIQRADGYGYLLNPVANMKGEL